MNIPIFQGSKPATLRDGSAVFAIVDEEFASEVSKFRWFVSDPEKPKPPRSSVKIGKQIFHIYLNRFVFLMSQYDKEQRTTLLGDLPRFLSEIRTLQRVRTSMNPYDCRIQNLDGTINPRSTTPTAEKHKISDINLDIESRETMPIVMIPTADYEGDPSRVVPLPELPPEKSVLSMLDDVGAIDDKSKPTTIREQEGRTS